MFEQARHADELREPMADGYGRLLDVKTLNPPYANLDTQSTEPSTAPEILHAQRLG
jgi:hypothetical protein